jgi:serine/threonine protein kinase
LSTRVLVTEVDGHPAPKVIDFGVAKAMEFDLTDQSLNDTGAIVGMPTYMSPELTASAATLNRAYVVAEKSKGNIL